MSRMSDQQWLDQYSSEVPRKATKLPKMSKILDEEEGTEKWGKEGGGTLGGQRGARQKKYIESQGGMGVGR